MTNIRNKNDFTDAAAMGPYKVVPPTKTASSYNEPGLPTPPEGWGKSLGFTPREAPDTEIVTDGI